MTDLWQLPKTAEICGKNYEIHTDFRDILEIFRYFEDPDLPEFIRWQIALALFYEGRIPEADQPAAMAYLGEFLSGGHRQARPGPRLMDWQQDSEAIIADINRVAGQEIRALPYVHWWTFLAWFHSIGQGQLSTLVAIRDKLRRGKMLEAWEQEFYRQNRETVVLQKRRSKAEMEEVERLERMVGK